MKKNTFIKGALILIVFNLIGKVLGAVYRIPLSRILGTVGMGKYQLVFPLYALILTISTSGIPIIISKLVAEYNAKGDRYHAKKVLMTSFILLSIVSVVGLIIIVAGAKFFSFIEGNKDIYICFYAIAPAVLFAGFLSAFRGYFQGNLLMFPTALSGFVEQVAKISIGLYLAKRLLVFGDVYAVFGAVLGVSISEFCSFLFMFICYIVYTKKHRETLKNQPYSYKFLSKQLIYMSAPITFSGVITPLSSMIDSLIVVNLLIFLGFASGKATMMLGIWSGIVEPLVNIPTILSVSIATALLPSVSGKNSENSTEEIKNMVEKAIQISLSLSLAFFICFIIFGGQILTFLYGTTLKMEEFGLAIKLLFLGSINIIFLSLIQVFASVLHGLNEQKYVLKITVIGCVIKIVLDVCLISIYSLNIMGTVIAGGVSYLFVMLMGYKKVKECTSVKISTFYLHISLQACLVCVFAYFMNSILKNVFSDVVALFFAGGIAGLVFIVTYYMFFIHQKNKENSASA